MGKFAVVVIGIAIFVYALFDLIATPRARTRYLPKTLWFVVLLAPAIGPLLWLVVGHVRQVPPWPRPGGHGQPRPPRGPDDDPDYLRNL